MASHSAPRSDRGRSELGLLSRLSPPLPPPFLHSLPRPPPSPSPLHLNSLTGVRVRLPSSQASASLRSYPTPLTPPALYLPALAGPVGSRGDGRARTRTGRGAECKTSRRGVSGIREGGLCICVFYGVASRGASGGLKEGEGEAKRESPSARASNLVRVPGRPGSWE